MKTKAFEQVPGWMVTRGHIKNPLGDWILSDPKWQNKGRFKTKREANRAIPMQEMK